MQIPASPEAGICIIFWLLPGQAAAVKSKTKEFLNLLLWSTDLLMRPTFRNPTDSYEGWVYRNGLSRQIATLEQLRLLERDPKALGDRLYRLTEQGRLHALGGRDPAVQWSRHWDGRCGSFCSMCRWNSTFIGADCAAICARGGSAACKAACGLHLIQCMASAKSSRAGKPMWNPFFCWRLDHARERVMRRLQRARGISEPSIVTMPVTSNCWTNVRTSRSATTPPPEHFNDGQLMSGQPGSPRWKLIRFCRNGSCRRITWVARLGSGGSKCSVWPGNNYGRFAGKLGCANFCFR